MNETGRLQKLLENRWLLVPLAVAIALVSGLLLCVTLERAYWDLIGSYALFAENPRLQSMSYVSEIETFSCGSTVTKEATPAKALLQKLRSHGRPCLRNTVSPSGVSPALVEAKGRTSRKPEEGQTLSFAVVRTTAEGPEVPLTERW